MFKKLLSNLPFNPSLIGQVSFYAKRMHREEKIRQLGVAFIVLAMVLQVFAFIAPPESTLAQSGNDIIRGGFTTQAQAVDACETNRQDYKNILAHFDISCANLAAASTQNIRSTDYDKKLYSMGRIAKGPTGRSDKPTDEYSVKINDETYFLRYLWSFDTWAYSTYKALVGTNDSGQQFLILYNCGNPVWIDRFEPPNDPIPDPPEPEKPIVIVDRCINIAGIQTKDSECDTCPGIPGVQSTTSDCKPCDDANDEADSELCLQLSKQVSNTTQNIPDANGTTARANDLLEYTLHVSNDGLIQVSDFIIQENITDVLEYADLSEYTNGSFNKSTGILSWPALDIAPGQQVDRSFTVKIKDPLPETPVSISDSTSYDLTMTNVYGNAVNVHLPTTLIKVVEITTTTLPNTGPGENMAAAFALTTLVGYFLARSRIMAKELDFVKQEYASANGGN